MRPLTGLLPDPAGDRSILAHGIGGAQDLPISPELAIAGAVAALTVSFTVLALAWRSPRYDAGLRGRPVPQALATLVDSPAFAVALRVLGFALFLFTAWTAVLGEDLLINPVFGMFYVLLWVGIVPASLLLGPVWKAISPVRTLHLLLGVVTGSDPGQGLRAYPARLGYWPAALGLLAFVWFELVYPQSNDLGSVRLWCAAYVAVMLVGGAVFCDAFYERADLFEVYSSLVARLSVWGRRDGELVVLSPLANLATVPVAPGLLGVVAVLFGSTAYDSFQDSSRWLRFTQAHLEWSRLLDNVGLLAFCVGVGVVFFVGCATTGVSPGQQRRALPDLFAHSVVPIIVGYIVAHYLSYFVEVGQQTVVLMSDPMSDGSNLFGTADLAVNYWLSYHPTLLAVTKVLTVVLGHVLGVVAAHDRAVSLLPRRHQVTGQLPLLVAMVAFTVGGLYLLFAA
ncbi:MAG: hypothetical protein ABIQ15_02150 [Nocardioides sp.]